MKINRTAGPNKGQSRKTWVLVERETNEPLGLDRGLLVYPCRRDAEDARLLEFGFCKRELRIAEFRYEHLQQVYKRNKKDSAA